MCRLVFSDVKISNSFIKVEIVFFSITTAWSRESILFLYNWEMVIRNIEFRSIFSNLIHQSVRVDRSCYKNSTIYKSVCNIFEKSFQLIFLVEHIVNTELRWNYIKHNFVSDPHWFLSLIENLIDRVFCATCVSNDENSRESLITFISHQLFMPCMGLFHTFSW